MDNAAGTSASLPPPPPSAENANDANVVQLVAMGFPLEMAKAALTEAQLAVEHPDEVMAYAVELLFSGGGGGGGDFGAVGAVGDDALDAAAYDMVHEEMKMVLVVRVDLGMSPGKVASQCVHAALGCYRDMQHSNPAQLAAWERIGETAVCLRCTSLAELEQLEQAAQGARLQTHTVRDAGRTEVGSGSKTVLAIGPDFVSRIDGVTGRLRLF
jgi:peptidyl-tRNA hydrolase